MPDFWPSSGFHLLVRDGDGRLEVTDAFLGAYLERPEMRLVEESCAAERALHAELVAAPRLAVEPARIAGLADADARDNYRILLAYRDRLVDAGTVEACYVEAFREARLGITPLFLDQMAQVVARNILDRAPDPMRARAAELVFRQQHVILRDGAALLADTQVHAMVAEGGGFGDLGRLLAEAGTAPRRVELDVLLEATASDYWQRDERHDTVLGVTHGRPGLAALAGVLEAWIEHLTGAAVRIEPLREISDDTWVWHIGLDAEASRILNDLYHGTEVGEERLARLLALFRLDFADPSLMRADVAGRPVYLAMAMTPDGKLRLKPQNLLLNLPLAAEA